MFQILFIYLIIQINIFLFYILINYYLKLDLSTLIMNNFSIKYLIIIIISLFVTSFYLLPNSIHCFINSFMVLIHHQ